MVNDAIVVVVDLGAAVGVLEAVDVLGLEDALILGVEDVVAVGILVFDDLGGALEAPPVGALGERCVRVGLRDRQMMLGVRHLPLIELGGCKLEVGLRHGELTRRAALGAVLLRLHDVVGQPRDATSQDGCLGTGKR